MFTPEMLESIKKVEATRDERMGMEPRRMTANMAKDPWIRIMEPKGLFLGLSMCIPMELMDMIPMTESRRAYETG